MANVTGDQDSVAQTKLENQRRRNPDTAPIPEIQTSKANIDKSKLRKDKKKDRGKALVSPQTPTWAAAVLRCRRSEIHADHAV
jgi:hypothetical protein